MTRLLTGIFVLALCSSCTVYQTNILDSNVRGKDEDPFTFENDSIRISYSFPKAVANIHYFNKSTTTPLYVDLSRSALVIDGNSNFFWTEDMEEDPVMFLPPATGRTTTPFNLPADGVPPNGKPTQEHFTPESSPIRFRTYLVLSKNEDFSDPIFLDHSFWLAERHRSRQPMYHLRGQNVYHAEMMTADGQAAATVFGVIAAIPVVWLIAQLDNEEVN